MKIYQERFVAFVDILGFREMVKQSENDSNLFAKLQGALYLSNSYGLGRTVIDDVDYQSVLFSDSMAISTEITQSGLYVLIWKLVEVWNNLVSLGFTFRGAIARGKLFHAGPIAFGQGLIDAYRMESRVAKYPRILLHPSMYSYAEGTDTPYKPYIKFINYFRIDFDGLFFLDVLGENCQQMVLPRGTSWEQSLLLRSFCISDMYNLALNPDVFSKMSWLARYFNEVLAENPNLKVRPIEIRSPNSAI